MSDTTHEPSRLSNEAFARPHEVEQAAWCYNVADCLECPAQPFDEDATCNHEGALVPYVEELEYRLTRLEAKAQALVAADDPEPLFYAYRYRSVTEETPGRAAVTKHIREKFESKAHAAWRTRQPLKADLAAVLEGSKE